MSLRNTKTNLRHTEASLPDSHTVHKPLPYRKSFLKPCFICIIKALKNKILIVINSAFDYSLSGAHVLHKLKHVLRGKEDI